VRRIIVIIVALAVVAGTAAALAFAGPVVAAVAAVTGVLATFVVWRRMREYHADDGDLAFLRSLDDRTEADFAPLLRDGHGWPGAFPLSGDTVTTGADAADAPAFDKNPFDTTPFDTTTFDTTPFDTTTFDTTTPADRETDAFDRVRDSWDRVIPDLDRNPLDDLADLDRVDPVAEVERLDAQHSAEQQALTDGAFFDDFHELEALLAASEEGLAFEAQMVDEAVASTDDILAASEATALVVDDATDDHSELAKLLAKVQARLTAYE